MRGNLNIRDTVQWIGLIAGPPLAAITFLVLPAEYSVGDDRVAFGVTGRATLAVMVWMATWWLTEAIHISATALLPLVLFPAFGVTTIRGAAAPYADPLIFLFLGGFLLALSMQRWGLGKRIALLTLRAVGTQPTHLIAGFMLITAVLSAFVSNTATTAMMLPIAISVIGLIQNGAAPETEPDEKVTLPVVVPDNFAVGLLLGIAYAASVGGVATIIGSPPNAILVGFLRERVADPYRIDISMAQWLVLGIPLVVVFLPIVLVILTRFLYPVQSRPIAGAKELIESEFRGLGYANRGEWVTFIVFMCTATLWISRPWLVELEKQFGFGTGPFALLKDAGIAVAAGLALFVIPVDFKTRQFTMDWKTAESLPWAILILFGGGLSLAAAVQSSGVAEFIGSQASHLADMPDIVLVLVVCAGMIFLTELTSNTATTAALVPVLAALAPGLGVHPYLLVFPAAVSASFAFMLPVATPPNAIVFGSGRISIPQMARVGVWLNLIGVLLVSIWTVLLVGPILGVDLWQ